MAKTLTKSLAKSAAKATPPRPVAKSAVKTPVKTAAKSAPAKPAAKAALSKASLAKKPTTKSSGAKFPPLKVLPKKTAPAKAPAAKAKPAAADAPPASEEEIIGAVSGKLSSRAGAAGFSWLGGKAETSAPVEIPVPPAVEPPPAAEAPAPATEGLIAPIIIEEVPPPVIIEEAVVVTVVEPETSPPVEEESTPAAVEPEPEPEAASLPGPVVSAVSETVAAPVVRDDALAGAFKKAAGQLGWALGLQGLMFLAFCVLVSRGGTPQTGIVHFLAAAIPLFSMFLLVGSFASYSATQVLLDRLEGNRSDLTNQRKRALLPAQVILGSLVIVWFVVGATVWWL